MRTRLRTLALLGCSALFPLTAQAGGPRFVTGPPFFTGQQGVAIGWHQPQLLYYTDPGALGPSVNHAASDALVAAAAGVWNLPVASITVAQGGSLGEHVSGQNVYLGGSGLVFPVDATAANAQAIPLAIIYDTDGSVTDLLLGSGASDPGSCRQNAVTESVDSFDPAGYILHAMLILNGRCSGPAPEQQLQLQYQLMRGFGRVLGLAWSQTNDNVFTGTPLPNYAQALHWPIMHPIDIVCGPYTYQCLPSPFQLRPDDIASMVAVYPIAGGAVPAAGKQVSLSEAHAFQGIFSFPTSQGMRDVNVLLRQGPYKTQVFERYYTASAVTGAYFRPLSASPFVSANPSVWNSFGSNDPGEQGRFRIPYAQLDGSDYADNDTIETEPINPLYTLDLSLGPTPAGVVEPSGSAQTQTQFVVYPGFEDGWSGTVSDAAPVCGDGSDGAPGTPAPAAATGWWTGLICGYGHAAYWLATVRPSRSFTVEVTALDEQGIATTGKLMPVIGLFAPTDTPGSLPSQGVAPTAFQGLQRGSTVLTGATGQLTSLTIGIADERGDGRPDFTYQARFFYADTVSPAALPVAGGTLTVTGSGFRPGNAVTINGVAAPVQSWSANSIVLTAPSMQSAGASAGTAVDVVVSDLSTGATSTMSAALTYSAGPVANGMLLLSAPAGPLIVGATAAVPFAVRVVAADGSTPVPGQHVTLSSSSNAVSFAACSAAATCTLTTDSTGSVSSLVTATAAGAVTLQASDQALSQTASFTVIPAAGSIQILNSPQGSFQDGANAGNLSLLTLRGDGSHLPYRSLTFTFTAGAANLSGCAAATCFFSTDNSGYLQVTVTPLSVGLITILISDGNVTQTVSLTGLSSAVVLSIVQAPRSTVPGGQDPGTLLVRLTLADLVTPVPLSAVTFTAPAGVSINPCGGTWCPQDTNWSGYAQVYLLAQPGTYTVQVAYGTLTQSVTFTAQQLAPQLLIISAPSGNVPIANPPAVPFTVQYVQGSTPLAGYLVALLGQAGDVSIDACSDLSECQLWTDANGMVSSNVTPLVTGPIVLSAANSYTSVSTSFVSTGIPRSISIYEQPGPEGVLVGDVIPIGFKVTAVGGQSPQVDDQLLYKIMSNNFGWENWWSSLVYNSTDANGVSFVEGAATLPGPVTINVSDGYVNQTVTFMAYARPTQIKILSAPGPNGPVNAVEALPFTVQMLAADGVTPVPQGSVSIFSSHNGAGFGSCAGAPSCTLSPDANGIISTTVTPWGQGTITLNVSQPPLSAAVTFVSVGEPEILLLSSSPPGPLTVGSTSGAPFVAQILQPDGITPLSGQFVDLSVAPAGAVQFAACGTSSCTLKTDASGFVSTLITAEIPASATLFATTQLSTGPASVSAALQVVAPDQLRLVSAPASGSITGVPASLPFALQLLSPDGVTPRAGRSISLAVESGSASFAQCAAASTCVLQTDANGNVSSLVTPSAAGAIRLQASAGAVVQTATFTASAAPQPDHFQLSSTPGATLLTGASASTPLTALVTLADGITPVAGVAVLLSQQGAGSVLFTACAATSCPLTTDASGTVSTGVTGGAPGSATLLATAALPGGTQSLSTPLQVLGLDQMVLVSAPSTGAYTAVAASVPFAIQLLLADGVTPAANHAVALAVTSGAAGFAACSGAASCTVQTDSNGRLSTAVTPQSPGSITLSASEGAVARTATFSAATQPLADLVHITSTPPSTLLTGTSSPTPFSVRITLADGATPVAGVAVTLSASPAAGVQFAACAQATCSLLTDANGYASSGVLALAPGVVILSASAALPSGTQAVSFALQVTGPDQMRLLSAPASGAYVGLAASSPFAVQLLLADGVTAAPGRSVILSVTSGAAALSGCAVASACTLTTDASGRLSTLVTPSTAGTITLLAAEGSVQQSASFSAVPQPDVLQLVSAPAGQLFAAATSSALLVRVTAPDGVTPVAGVPITFSAASQNGGGIQFTTCPASSCSAVTDASGQAATSAVGITPGIVVLTATAALGSGAQTVSSSVQVVAHSWQMTPLTGATYVFAGAVVQRLLTVAATEDASPAVGVPVTWTASPDAAPLAAQTVTDATGSSTGGASFGPLAAAASTSVSACAQPAVCASFRGIGVDPAQLQVTIASGGGQAASSSSSFTPVVVLVQDAAGHPVAGAPVSIYQTVTALDVTCPDRGRCPAEPVLSTQASVVVSGANGTVSVTPLAAIGPSQIAMAFSAGTQGFAATTLTSQP